MSKAELAAAKHDRGYNCCQAVVCAFADEIGADEALLYKIGEGFGFGMGSGMGVCGAMSGAAMVVGLIGSDGRIEQAGKTKGATYKTVARIQREFAERAKRLICREIKTGNGGRAFTSCDECVRIAAEITEEYLKSIRD